MPGSSLSHHLALLSGFLPDDLPALVQDLPQDLIQQALWATGTATIRRRRLPAEQVVWLVLGMALFRRLNIVQVLDQLDLSLPTSQRHPVVPSAIHQARARLGPMPLMWLFTATAQRWTEQRAHEDAWRGLTLYGVDGTILRVEDSEENRAYFGGPTTPRGPCGYPICRLVALLALRSHLVRAATFGPYGTDELAYAHDLWDAVPDDSLTLLDRRYFAAHVFCRFLFSGQRRHFLVRVKNDFKATVLKRMGPGDDLVEWTVTKNARAKDPALPKTLVLRRLVCHCKGYRPWVLLTSLLDPIQYPAGELAALYHERWEQELGYDEIKTELLEQNQTLRSRSPQLVEQEVWGVLLAYNLVRLEMTRLAKLAGVAPVQLSFAGSLMMLLQLWQTLPLRYTGTIPGLIRTFEAQMQRLLLPPRRTERRYPRAVKVKMSNYLRKRPVSDGRRA